MKEKTIEKLEPIKTRKQGLVGTIQRLNDTFIINIYHNRILHYKYCIDFKTKDYRTLDVLKGIWEQKKILSITDSGYNPQAYWRTPNPEIRLDSDTQELLDIINAKTEVYNRKKDLISAIDLIELRFNQGKRESAYMSKATKVRNMIERTPMVSEAKIKAWAINRINPDHYLLKTKEGCSCTFCGTRIESEAKRGQTEECPQCKTLLKVKITRPETLISYPGMICLLQSTEYETIARHIDCEVVDQFGHARKINTNEAVRIVVDTVKRRGRLEERTRVFYGQINKRDYYSRQFTDRGLNVYASLWQSNPCNRQIKSGYLYPEGIEEALELTNYRNITNLLKYMAEKGIKANYNHIMYAHNVSQTIDTLEYLAKGRFYKLTEECSEAISMYDGEFRGYEAAVHNGDDIHETLNIQDTQLINRLREKDGGNDMLRILQWIDIEGLKISDEALTFLSKEKISARDLLRLTEKINITPTALVNYLKKQKANYKTLKYNSILNQWLDYLSMLDRLGKKYTEELFYKPKNLRQRHDEVAEEVNARARELELKDAQKIAKQQAKEYREKFPQAESILKDIKDKFEYTGEQMSILVPKNLSEIIADGRTLHHCAGATNRYFDRIENRETFICFLRKNDAIKIPFYTIEVEPGGTIRQHRGMYDEEPELETVKPFLKEWQKEIKKRMSKEDKKLAKISKIKREANIEDLKARNNTFVLKGLMEDFMEA